MDGETNIFQVYYIVLARDLILSFPPRPRRNMSDGKKETVSITTFKNWPFANDFKIEIEDGKFLSVLCKYYSEVEYNDFMREASFVRIQ